jgi:hypothetical protein
MIVVGFTFLLFWLLIGYFPKLAKVCAICFLSSICLLALDPALGAVFTLGWLGMICLMMLIIALPLILSYAAGILFIMLFVIGLAELIPKH